MLSFSFLCVSLLIASPSLLYSSTDPQTLLSSSQTITDLHEPSRHRPIAADPHSATNLTHFGLSSLFSAFWLCVSGCACVLALCFGLCLCFGFVFFGLGLCFELWFFCFLFFFFFTGFDVHGGVVLVFQRWFFCFLFFVLLHWFW